MIFPESLRAITTSEEVFHLVVHIVQIAIVLAALYRLTQNYRAVRSRFNLGLVVFGLAMVLQIILFLIFFTLQEETIFHVGGELAETLALVVFLYLISK